MIPNPQPLVRHAIESGMAALPAHVVTYADLHRAQVRECMRRLRANPDYYNRERDRANFRNAVKRLNRNAKQRLGEV